MPTPLAPLTDQGTRRAAQRAARPYRIVAITFTVASFVWALLDLRAWLLVAPINLVALAIARAGRSHARRATGVDPGNGADAGIAQGAATVGLGVGIVLAITAVAMLIAAVVVLAVFSTLLDDCTKSLGHGSSLGVEK